VLQDYSPFGRGSSQLLSNEKLGEIAKQMNKTIAQVILRWGLQHGDSVIPKASSESHLRENSNIFDFQLSPEFMSQIDSLHSDWHSTWDPSKVI